MPEHTFPLPGMPNMPPDDPSHYPAQLCAQAAYHEPHTWTDYDVTHFVFYCEGLRPGE